jgi:enterochelin esterase family protein
MKKLILVCGALLLALCAQAQRPAALPSGLTPLPSNINKNGYPAVTEDGRVVFRLRAPGAEKVQLDLGRLYDMTREENGFWTVTTDPQELGFHYYSLVLEGISVADPASESYYGMGRMASGIDIPEPGVDFYTLQDVPHGTIRSEWYYSEVTGSWRHMNVYTPPGYDTATDTRYPVMYLWHGGGEDERGWAVQGRTDIILDNLIAAGEAVPMIVVIGNGNASTGGYTDDAMETFRRELVESIIPYVEGRYRAYTDAKHRAISGLSMGGGQAYYTGLRNPELFSAVGVYSSGLFGRSADAPLYDAES